MVQPKRKRSSLARALSNFCHNLLECLGVLLHKLGEYFSIERNIVLLERVGEFAIREILSSKSLAYRSLPILPKCSLFGLPVAKRIFPRMAQGVFREPHFCLSSPAKPLRLFQDAFSAPMRNDSSLNSCHKSNCLTFF